jgi:hypothetical protein
MVPGGNRLRLLPKSSPLQPQSSSSRSLIRSRPRLAVFSHPLRLHLSKGVNRIQAILTVLASMSIDSLRCSTDLRGPRAAQPTAPDADAAPKRRLLPEQVRGDGAPGADYDEIVMSEEPPLPPAVHDLCSSPPQRTPALPTNGTEGMEAYTSENIRSVQLEAVQLDGALQLSVMHAPMQLSTKEASPSKAAEQADKKEEESFRMAQDLEPVRMDMAFQLAEIQRGQSEADARGREHDREEASAEEAALYTSMDNQLVLTARADAAR